LIPRGCGLFQVSGRNSGERNGKQFPYALLVWEKMGEKAPNVAGNFMPQTFGIFPHRVGAWPLGESGEKNQRFQKNRIFYCNEAKLLEGSWPKKKFPI